jgi:aminopeptidase YwaD
MYDYCQQGWPTAIEDISALGIVVYPNPTKDMITIETRLEIEVELYDMIGNKVISEHNAKRLDLSKLSNGIYNLSIIHKDRRYSKKVIKQ